jgi:hypothetical protein
VRRDFPCPGDGGRRYPQRNAYWPILAATALLLAARPGRLLRNGGGAMSTEREGDIVRVVIEGEVLSAHGRRLDISGGHSVILDNVVSVEVLRPPVKVGDVIEQWQGLPGGSILADSDGRACQVFEFDDRSPTLQALGGASYGPFTVLYLPDGAA